MSHYRSNPHATHACSHPNHRKLKYHRATRAPDADARCAQSVILHKYTGARRRPVTAAAAAARPPRRRRQLTPPLQHGWLRGRTKTRHLRRRHSCHRRLRRSFAGFGSAVAPRGCAATAPDSASSAIASIGGMSCTSASLSASAARPGDTMVDTPAEMSGTLENDDIVLVIVVIAAACEGTSADAFFERRYDTRPSARLHRWRMLVEEDDAPEGAGGPEGGRGGRPAERCLPSPRRCCAPHPRERGSSAERSTDVYWLPTDCGRRAP